MKCAIVKPTLPAASLELQLWACGENVAVLIAAGNTINRVMRCQCHLKRKERAPHVNNVIRTY